MASPGKLVCSFGNSQNYWDLLTIKKTNIGDGPLYDKTNC